MSNQMAQLQEATIKAQCKTLRMPMIASQFGPLPRKVMRVVTWRICCWAKDNVDV